MTDLEFSAAKQKVDAKSDIAEIVAFFPFMIVPDTWGLEENLYTAQQINPLQKKWQDSRIATNVNTAMQGFYNDLRAGYLLLKSDLETELSDAITAEDEAAEALATKALDQVNYILSCMSYTSAPGTWSAEEQVYLLQQLKAVKPKWQDLRINGLITTVSADYYGVIKDALVALNNTLTAEFSASVPFAIKTVGASYNPSSDSALTVWVTATAGTYTNFPDATATPLVINSGEYAHIFKVGDHYEKIVQTVGTALQSISNPDELIKANSVCKSAGKYLTTNISTILYPNSGYVNSSGTFTAGSFNYTDEIDVSAVTHVYFTGPASASAGYIFYDASHVPMTNTFGLGDNTYRYVKVPAGAKYFRCSKSSGTVASTVPIYLRNFFELGTNEWGFIDGSLNLRRFTDTPDAVIIATTSGVVPNKSIAMLPGIYRTKQLDIDYATFSPGFQSITGDVFTPSGSYKQSPQIDVSGYTHIEAKLIYNGGAGIVFYNAAGNFMTGSSAAGTNQDPEVLTKYPIPYGAKYARIAIPNTIVDKVTRIIKEVEVKDNQIALFNAGTETILTTVSATALSVSQLLDMLPVGDGSGVSVGDYYWTTAGNLKKKLA